MKTEDFLRDLGIKDKRVTIATDDLEIVAGIEEIDRSLIIGDNPTKNDDYTISFTTEEDRLLFLYVDMHSLEAYIYEEYTNFQFGLKEKEVTDLVEEYGWDIVENFIEDHYIIALDETVIKLDDYQEIYKKWVTMIKEITLFTIQKKKIIFL